MVRKRDEKRPKQTPNSSLHYKPFGKKSWKAEEGRGIVTSKLFLIPANCTRRNRRKFNLFHFYSITFKMLEDNDYKVHVLWKLKTHKFMTKKSCDGI